MNITNNTDTRSKSIEWFTGLTPTEQEQMIAKYYPKRHVSETGGGECVKMYEAEHPSHTAAIEGIKEESVRPLSGEMEIDSMEWLKAENLRLYRLSTSEMRKNDALVSALKEAVTHETNKEKLNDAFNDKYVMPGWVGFAKELLNNLKS